MMLAHQGGWDEVLFALTPLVVVAVLLMIANKRANAAKKAADQAAAGDHGPSGRVADTKSAKRRSTGERKSSGSADNP